MPPIRDPGELPRSRSVRITGNGAGVVAVRPTWLIGKAGRLVSVTVREDAGGLATGGAVYAEDNVDSGRAGTDVAYSAAAVPSAEFVVDSVTGATFTAHATDKSTALSPAVPQPFEGGLAFKINVTAATGAWVMFLGVRVEETVET